MKKFTKKHAKLVAAVTLAASMIGASSVFALNTAGDTSSTGNKPFSFIGYEVVDSTHVALYFNKKTTSGVRDIVAGQFEVVPDGGGSNMVSSITISAGNGSTYTDTTNTSIANGTKVVLNLGSSLTDNNLYDVTIDGSVMNDNGITIGNYQNRKDITFTFQDPDSGGEYNTDNAPVITYVVGDGTTNVSYESDTVAIFSRPVDLSYNTTFKSGMNSNFDNTTLSRDVQGYESYGVSANDASSSGSSANTFYFPMTNSGSASTVYNRLSDKSYSYSLDIPEYSEDAGESSFNPAAYTFSTAGTANTGYDYPGWENNASTAGGTNAAPTVSLNSTTLSVSFYNTWVDPNPDGYYVYAINYTDTGKDEYTPLTDGSWFLVGGSKTTGHTDGYYQTVTGTVTAGKVYKVRIVPYKTYNSVDYKVGVSKAGSN